MTGTVKNTYHSTTASRSDAQMLVANLRHVQIIPVSRYSTQKYVWQRKVFYATVPNHVSLKFDGMLDLKTMLEQKDTIVTQLR